MSPGDARVSRHGADQDGQLVRDQGGQRVALLVQVEVATSKY
jgi:hypothetical protein